MEEPAPIFIATPAALMQRVIPKEDFKRSYLYLVAGQDLQRDALLAAFGRCGAFKMCRWWRNAAISVCAAASSIFSRQAMRGPCGSNSTAIDWSRFVSSVHANQRSERLQEEMLFLPMKEFSLKRSGLDAVVRRLDQRAAELEMDRRESTSLLESLRAGIPVPGIEFLVPYFYPDLVSIAAYLPAETLIWLDGADRVEAETEKFAQLAWERYEKAKEDRHLVSPVEGLYLNEHEWRAALQPRSQVCSESLTIMASSGKTQELTLTVESFLTSDLRHETAPRGADATLAPLVERLKGWQSERVFFVAPTKGDAVPA